MFVLLFVSPTVCMVNDYPRPVFVLCTFLFEGLSVSPLKNENKMIERMYKFKSHQLTHLNYFYA